MPDDEQEADPLPGDVVVVPVRSVLVDRAVRVAGVDRRHVVRLAEVADRLPPIVVNRRTMRVVDGIHRLRAAELRGDRGIRAVFVDGDETADLALAVRLNARHGLPLSRRDRVAAVDRLLASCPRWSDRRIAATAGVAHTTVAAARRRSPGGRPGSTVGRDGRVRHGDPRAARRRAADLLAERPGATLREIARLAGLSPATVLDVRREMAREGSVGARAVDRPTPDRDPVAALDTLRKDPSLRYSTAGRTLVRLLSLTLGVPDPARLVSAVPPHSRSTLADLARRSAEQWLRTATELETMNRKDGTRTS